MGSQFGQFFIPSTEMHGMCADKDPKYPLFVKDTFLSLHAVHTCEQECFESQLLKHNMFVCCLQTYLRLNAEYVQVVYFATEHSLAKPKYRL